jgi:hypothetical protein
MKPADIVDALRTKLSMPGGRHLYGVLGTYEQLRTFSSVLQTSTNVDGQKFSQPINVNLAILKAIPDEEFKKLVADEAKRPEPTAAYVAKAFDTVVRREVLGKQLLVLAHLEMLFAYHLELNLLRTLAADDQRVLLLLPGKRYGGKVIIFQGVAEGNYALPTNLIADNHLWELKN